MDQDRHVERVVSRARQQVAFALLGALATASFLTICGAGCSAGCSSSSKDAGQPRDPSGVVPPSTTTTGTIVQVDVAASASSPTARTVYAMSDIHGGYDRMVTLLMASSLVAVRPASPSTLAWSPSAKDAVLVVAGDLIDKGPQAVEVIDGLRALEASASAAGGQVIVLLGNHEAEFFVNPTNSKANASDGLDVELGALQIDPARVASGAEPRGAWLLARPFGARVGDFFFSHGGSTRGRSLADLETLFRTELDAHPTFDSPEIVGDGSILEARGWYDDVTVAPANAKALGVAHIAFGHDPNALGARGAIAVAQSSLLLRIDCGMSPDVNDSTGCMLRVRRAAGLEIAEELHADGTTKPLFTTAPTR